METSSSSLANQFQSLIRTVFLPLDISSTSVRYHAHPSRVWLHLLLSFETAMTFPFWETAMKFPFCLLFFRLRSFCLSVFHHIYPLYFLVTLCFSISKSFLYLGVQNRPQIPDVVSQVPDHGESLFPLTCW